MHALVGIWSMDQRRRAEQDSFLTQNIVPAIAASPGFIAGVWMRDTVTGKAHSVVLYDTPETAAALKAVVEGDTREQARNGVTNDLLSLVEVVAAEFAPAARPAAGPRR